MQSLLTHRSSSSSSCASTLFLACRLKVFEALKGQGSDIDVACSEKEFGGSDQFAEFEIMLAAMERSRFCLVITGDAMSTRRLSEIFMAGVQSTWHSMQLRSLDVADHHGCRVHTSVLGAPIQLYAPGV